MQLPYLASPMSLDNGAADYLASLPSGLYDTGDFGSG